MIVGVGTWELRLPGASSLKEKRMVVRSLKDRLGKLNVSVAETGHQDARQRAELSVALVGTDTRFVESVLTKIDGLIERETRATIVNTHRDLW